MCFSKKLARLGLAFKLEIGNRGIGPAKHGELKMQESSPPVSSNAPNRPNRTLDCGFKEHQ